MANEKCPECKEELYKGWSPIVVYSSKGNVSVEIEVLWCENCNKVIEADWT